MQDIDQEVQSIFVCLKLCEFYSINRNNIEEHIKGLYLNLSLA